MTQEEKQLLLKDLCGRLPYGVKFQGEDFNVYTLDAANYFALQVEDMVFKPYLRPMNSMTEEEIKEFQAFHCVDEWHPYFYQQMCNLPNLENMFNWLNKHHFDYRGLIKKGLALEAPEGMYKYRTELQARYHLTSEEAREIIRTHGLGYSTLEFTQALQVIEEDNEIAHCNLEQSQECYGCSYFGTGDVDGCKLTIQFHKLYPNGTRQEYADYILKHGRKDGSV